MALTSLKSQAEVPTPQAFFLRPDLEEGKFPEERRFEFSSELRARIQAQEQAGRLVFTGEQMSSPVTPTQTNVERVDLPHDNSTVTFVSTPGMPSEQSLDESERARLGALKQ